MSRYAEALDEAAMRLVEDARDDPYARRHKGSFGHCAIRTCARARRDLGADSADRTSAK
jgi:hypothetical protein